MPSTVSVAVIVAVAVNSHGRREGSFKRLSVVYGPCLHLQTGGVPARVTWEGMPLR